MEHRVLGSSGIQVSVLSLGTMMFGAWGNPDHDECVRMTHAALDAGVNLVDTADVYAAGESEEVLGRALRGRRDDVVVATKFHNPMGSDPNRRGNSRRWVVQACEESLRRLGTEWIDIYQVHRPDPTCGIDDTLGALSDLVHQGKVRAIGTSTFPADELEEAQWTAVRGGHERFVSEQPPYSLFARRVEAAVLPTCLHHRVGVLAWSPLNGGWLTGKYRRDAPPPPGSRAAREPDHFDYGSYAHDRKLGLVEALTGLADEAGTSLIRLALAWVLAHPAVTSAVMGPRTIEQLVDQLGAEDLHLEAELLDRIDELVPPATNVNGADAGWVAPALVDPRARRRAQGRATANRARAGRAITENP